MSLETVSAKKNRVYQRAFDHELAIELHDAGWTYAAIARTLAVSPAAVGRVCDPAVRERMDQRTNALFWRRRTPCKGGCGTLVWSHGQNRSGYCYSCITARKAAAQAAANERPTELRCTNCGKWKPDEEFGRDPRTRRRGRRPHCRECETTARREYRRAHPEQEWAAYVRAYDVRRARKDKTMIFVVLRKCDDGRWEERGRPIAVSRQRAVEHVADSEGIWVAVPEAQMTELPVRATQAFKIAETARPRLASAS